MHRSEARRGLPWADRRAAVAVEFALVGLAFITLIVGIMQVGFCLYARIVLDHAAATMSRQLQTGIAKATAAAGMQNFITMTACGALSGLLDCSLITVKLYPVADYLNASGTPPQFDPGVSKSLMLLTVTYRSPLPTWPLDVAANGVPMSFTSSVPFVNEY